MNASSGSTTHGSTGSVRPRSSAPGSLPNAVPTVGIPQHLEPQPLAVERRASPSVAPAAASSPSSAAPRRSGRRRRRGARFLLAQRVRRRRAVSGASSAPSLALDRALQQRARAACRRASAAPTSRGRRGASCARGRPSGARSPRATRRPAALAVSSGKRSSTSATCTPTQSSTGAHHSRASQSKRRPGMPRTTVDDVRVVGEARARRSGRPPGPRAARRSGGRGRAASARLR